MLIKIKSWYLKFIEKEYRNFYETFFFFFLYLLSIIYGVMVRLRNKLYDNNILPVYSSKRQVISIGNISWAGSGKTPLSLWLYEVFSSHYRVAILRRGYGQDEGKMLQEKVESVFSDPDRRKKIKELERFFDLFLLDDGFQYRKVKPDINILVMGAREFKKKFRLIPVYFFREHFDSLKRADIVILNYADELNNPSEIKNLILKTAPTAKLYCANYKIKRFIDLKNKKEIDQSFLKSKKLAAFSAIGYPEGFFDKLKGANLPIKRQIKYPDHYELTDKEFISLENDLINDGIEALVITAKDKYHIPAVNNRIDIYVLEVEMVIENSQGLIDTISQKIKINN